MLELLPYFSGVGSVVCNQTASMAGLQEFIPKFYNLFARYGEQISQHLSSTGKTRKPFIETDLGEKLILPQKWEYNIE